MLKTKPLPKKLRIRQMKIATALIDLARDVRGAKTVQEFDRVDFRLDTLRTRLGNLADDVVDHEYPSASTCYQSSRRGSMR